MKVDYISRDDALNEIHRFRGYIDEDIEYRMKLAINKIPSADVAEVRHGKWIRPTRVPDSILDECSICGFDTGAFTFKYCPNCGADMRMDGE